MRPIQIFAIVIEHVKIILMSGKEKAVGKEALPLEKLDEVFKRSSQDPETNEKLARSMTALGAKPDGGRFFYILFNGREPRPKKGESCYHVSVGIDAAGEAVYDYSGPFEFGKTEELEDSKAIRKEAILTVTASGENIHKVLSGEKDPFIMVMSKRVGVEGKIWAQIMRAPNEIKKFFKAIEPHYLAVLEEHLASGAVGEAISTA